MNAKELKRLSRRDLLEILLEQSKQMQQLRKELNETRDKLTSRELELEEAGSIAEAAMRVNGVFEAAQAASQQYVDNIKRLSQRQEAICQEMERACCQKIKKRLEETEKTRADMLAETQKQCAEILTRARAQAAKNPEVGNE